MTVHILGFAYKPKDVGVSEGYIRQTIRTLSVKPRKVDDEALLHGWKGRPYYSDWSWRRRDLITEIIPIKIMKEGFRYLGAVSGFSRWDCPNADRLALKDGIVPPTGLELKKVLLHFTGGKTPVRADIIRW